jgi:hypothetical protein
MTDFIVAAVIIVIVAAAAIFVIASKKRGRKCIGCPDSNSCSGGCPGCTKTGH